MQPIIYPVTKTTENCNDYKVYINGKEVALNTARVSSQPFNRRWPGHQRQIEQTELVNFLSFAMDEEVELKVIPVSPFSSLKIRPRRLEIDAEVAANGIITIRLKKPAYFSIEPYGTEHALHVFADPVKSYDIDKREVIYYGAGEYDVGRIDLKSNQTLFIDEGAVVYASVYVLDAENVKILGRGILDNSKNKEEILFSDNVENNCVACNNAKRKHAINIICCKNVEIDGITVRDSLLYTIENVSCENVNIKNVKIIGNWRFNSDGIHFANCINCTLSDSFLRVYDDAVCVRGYAKHEYDDFLNERKDFSFTCKHIRVNNCTIWNDWGKGLQLGTETYASEISDVLFENCDIIRVSFGPLYLWSVDSAKVHDIRYKRIFIEYDEYNRAPLIQTNDNAIYTYKYENDFACPFIACLIEKHFEYSMTQDIEELGSISDIYFDDIYYYSLQKPFFIFGGLSNKSSCKNVLLKNIFWNDEKIASDFFEKHVQKNQFCFDIKLEE